MTDESVVPIIDIATFIDGTDLVSAPRAIDHAATTSGFFQITGHGIEPGVIDAAYAVAAGLNRLPREVKETLRSPSGHPYRGLMSNYDKRGRLVSEGYTVSRFDGPEDAAANGVDPELAGYFHENVWPPVEGFREAMTALQTRTRALGVQLMRAFAVGLDLPIDHFDANTVLDASTSTIRSYPPRGEVLEVDPTVIFDEHFDGGTLTMLHQRGTYEGLQVRTRTGEWFSVPVHDDAFVINMGELMYRITNGKWPATKHRVIAASDPAGFRYTLPTFFNVSVDTVIAPVPGVNGEPNPEFDPVMVFDWERRHIKNNYNRRQHTTAAASTEAYVAGLRD